jgi:PKD domain-containing protein
MSGSIRRVSTRTSNFVNSRVALIILLSLCQLSCISYAHKNQSAINSNRNSQPLQPSNAPGQATNSNLPIKPLDPSDPHWEPSAEELDKAIPDTLRKRMACSIEENVVVTPDEGGPAPLKVTFDATQSTAPCGRIVKWIWKFGDGSKSSGAKVTHIYRKPGEYFATLEMRDNKRNLNYLQMEYAVAVN